MSGYKELRSLSVSTNGDVEKFKWLYISLALQCVFLFFITAGYDNSMHC